MYNNWYGETDSTVLLGNIRDENPALGVSGTVANTDFFATYIGQPLIDLATVLGPSPSHAASNIYRAGGRGGFPLIQIPSTSPEITNDTDNRYCQYEEDIESLFTTADIGNGDQILGSFAVRFEGVDFFAEWSNLTAYETDNGKYAVHVDRENPNRSFGTIPNFNLTGSDSSNFEVYFERGASGGGSGLAGNTIVFGPSGSGADYSDWNTMLASIETSLDSTNQYTVYVMPGFYEVSDATWSIFDINEYDGSTYKRMFFKNRVPSYLHVVGLNKDSVIFNLSTNYFNNAHKHGSPTLDSTTGGINPSVFFASQFSSVSNLTIKVNNEYVAPPPDFLLPVPIAFYPDSSTAYVSYFEDFLDIDYDNYIGATERSPAKLLNLFLFRGENINFVVSGWGNSNSCVFAGHHRSAGLVSSQEADYPKSIYDIFLLEGVDVWSNSFFYFNRCSVKDSQQGKVGFGLNYHDTNGISSNGETFSASYCNLIVDSLYYEFDMILPETEHADSTHGWVVPSAKKFVVKVGKGSIPYVKIFNNSVFTAPNCFVPSSDSTYHLGNKFSFSYTAHILDGWESNEEVYQQYSDFPCLVYVSSNNQIDLYSNDFNRKSIHFNNCEFRVTGLNHPQLGNDNLIDGGIGDIPYVDTTDYISEFCVGVSSLGDVDLVFNGCRFENHIDSPYSGLFVIGSDAKVSTSLDSLPMLNEVHLNNCTGESIGYGLFSVCTGKIESIESFYSRINISGGSYTSYKSPIVKTTHRNWEYNSYSPVDYTGLRVYSNGTIFRYAPGPLITGSLHTNARNAAPLWLDTTTVGGVFEFDTTTDMAVFENCSFGTPSLKNYADIGYFAAPGVWLGLDKDLVSVDKNYQFGSIFMFYQDSTSWSEERFQFSNCTFSSGIIPPFRLNTIYSKGDFAPALVSGCRFFTDSTMSDLMSENLLNIDSGIIGITTYDTTDLEVTVDSNSYNPLYIRHYPRIWR